MEGSLEEVPFDLSLTEPWLSLYLGFLSHKMGIKSEW